MRFFGLIVAVTFGFATPLAKATTKGLSQIVTPDLQPARDLSLSLQVNPAIYFPNYHPERILGYIVFTYTFHLWAKNKEKHDQTVPGG